MKKVILLCLLVMVSSVSFGADLSDQKPTVEKIYDGWDLDKVYVMTDPQRNKWCYVLRDNGRVGIQCFDIKEEKN